MKSDTNTDTNKTTPTDITLHQKTRELEITFTDGASFKLPCEYLRVFSTAAEVKTADKPEHGKKQVNIAHIEPQGSYALRLFFDDDHDTGIYSWDTLYTLGKDYQANWSHYLQQLEKHGLSRDEQSTNLSYAGNEIRSIRLRYFLDLAQFVGAEQETVNIPASVTDVRTLLHWLVKRDFENAGKNISKLKDAISANRIHVTINKQFAEAHTPVTAGDDITLLLTEA